MSMKKDETHLPCGHAWCIDNHGNNDLLQGGKKKKKEGVEKSRSDSDILVWMFCMYFFPLVSIWLGQVIFPSGYSTFHTASMTPLAIEMMIFLAEIKELFIILNKGLIPILFIII